MEFQIKSMNKLSDLFASIFKAYCTKNYIYTF